MMVAGITICMEFQKYDWIPVQCSAMQYRLHVSLKLLHSKLFGNPMTPVWSISAVLRTAFISTTVIAISGIAAGLAGFVNVASQEGRLTGSFFDGYVFSGVLIAFLSRNDPIIVVIVGFLLAVLFVTGQTLQVFYQIPFTMVQLVEAINACEQRVRTIAGAAVARIYIEPDIGGRESVVEAAPAKPH